MSDACQSGGCNIAPTISAPKSLHFKIQIDTIGEQIQKATARLLVMAENVCWNHFSDNARYILSEIKQQASNTNRKETNKSNANKALMSLEAVSNKLKPLFNDLYEITLYVYHSKKDETIIAVQYFLKSDLDKDYYEIVKDDAPTLHSKVRTPPYQKNSGKTFDVNWELGGFVHDWKMYWFKRKMNK